jgi:hypothetical protein
MTSLIAWVGVDNRVPTSIYLASDSRITWLKNEQWDYGRKVFASNKYPEIFGYVGDVLFPSQVLSRILNMLDCGMLFKDNFSSLDKVESIYNIIKRSFSEYPLVKHIVNPFTIVYCTRENERMRSVFHCFKFHWDFHKGWSEIQKVDIPSKSGIIDVFGSGSENFRIWNEYWNNTTEKGTSRIAFSSFCDALQSGRDPHTGGAPQLVGIYQIGLGRTFGIIYKKQRYFLGFPVQEDLNLQILEWRNELFERCHWQTMEIMEGGQKHKKPKGLGNALTFSSK